MGGLGGKNRFCLEQLMKSADSLTERERERRPLVILIYQEAEYQTNSYDPIRLIMLTKKMKSERCRKTIETNE